MGKRRKTKHRNSSSRGASRPPYYNNKHLTVGMLEDLCKKIKDKTAIVFVGDSKGNFPDPAKKGLLVVDDGKVVTVNICGTFSWNAADADDDDDEDEEDDSSSCADVCGIPFDSKASNDSEADCMPIGKEVKYL